LFTSGFQIVRLSDISCVMEIDKSQTSANQSPDDPFRWVLKRELQVRCENNAGYSLRAFARDLGISPAALSSILNRKRRLTNSMKLKLALRINLPSADIQKYCQIETNSPSQNLLFSHINEDLFAIISDWYHMAILELVNIDGFELNAANVSKRLKISVSDANFALERLINANLLFKENGKWQSRENTNMPVPEHATEAVKKYLRQSLQKSTDALNHLPRDIRDHSTITVATSADKIDEAKKLITKFRRELNEFLSDSPKKNQVYQLQVSLFPLTGDEK
jgi:transcriptional regulator with XRE-family HTH domain